MVTAGQHHDRPLPLEDFGIKVRQCRTSAGLSQADLAKKTSISKSHIGKIELGRTRCARDIAIALDEALGIGETLRSLWDEWVKSAVVPTWFDWFEIEGDPSTIAMDSYECLVVPGLLQTESYASALLYGNQDKITFRMRRQGVLTREDPPPPRVSFLISETALNNPVGDEQIMREQLEHLLSLESPRVYIQIVPYPMPPTGTDGPFVLATLMVRGERAELAYVDTPARGFTLSDNEDIRVISDKLADIRTRALPVDLSRDLIRKVVKDRWT